MKYTVLMECVYRIVLLISKCLLCTAPLAGIYISQQFSLRFAILGPSNGQKKLALGKCRALCGDPAAAYVASVHTYVQSPCTRMHIHR